MPTGTRWLRPWRSRCASATPAASRSRPSRCAARSGSSRAGGATPPPRLSGGTQRWAETLRPLQFTNVAIMVPRFTGSIELDLPVMLSYDLEIGSTRYFAGLDDGEVPLLLLFSGTVFGMTDGRLQAQQVPWSKEAAYRLPISIWREAVDAHFPNSAWIKMSRQTLDELQRFKTRTALPTWDATIQALLAAAAKPADNAEGQA